MKRVAVLVVGTHALLAASTASAHAFLDHAQPPVGSTVRQAPAQIRMWFTERLEPAFSSAEVEDASGKPLNAAKAQVDASDPTLLTIDAPSLAPGKYRVKWRVLSVDTHATEGDFTFTVAP